MFGVDLEAGDTLEVACRNLEKLSQVVLIHLSPQDRDLFIKTYYHWMLVRDAAKTEGEECEDEEWV
jgi:hypothetical protein